MQVPRSAKLAQVVNYSLPLKLGQLLWLRTTPLAQELQPAVFAGARSGRLDAGRRDGGKWLGWPGLKSPPP